MFEIKKFISGFNILNGERAGKLLYYAVLIAVGLAIYHQITRPTTNIIAKKGSTVIQNQSKNWGIGGNIQSDKTFGISIIRFF